jgi:type IV pilus assembly protein PilV
VNPVSRSKRSQRGVSMIEVLVALIVVAFGLLGLAGLQARSMSFQKDSFDRKAATEVATQLTERVIANYDWFRTGQYNRTMLPAAAVPAAIPACGNALNCTAAEIANRDWAMWQIDLRRRLPVSGAYLVAPANAVELRLTVAWQEGQTTDGNPDPVCSAAPVNIQDPTFRCATWVIHP